MDWRAQGPADPCGVGGMRLVILAIVLTALTGCVSKVVSTVVTAPVKVVAKTADVLTTSQDEADRNLGRRVRKGKKQ